MITLLLVITSYSIHYTKLYDKHERKQKLRKAKKNMRPNSHGRGPRQRDWDHLADDEWDSPGFYEDERVMPLGSESRHKVVEAIANRITSYNVCYTKLLRCRGARLSA